MAMLDNLHQIAALAGREAIGSPIVEHEEIDLDQHSEQPCEASVTMSEIEIDRRGTRA